ncbi:hypothetical protein OG298_45390 (plasmid) [Streptomyces sp. NBC_01005]|uniref:hypothetical protein n=1 Tax=Streptomyces sp. NBC_01005 TaxID=2903715 RepID=UPI002F90CE4C|nr:hypothetical protein OG298_45390 [Streptomyces sp. NBC_01005]
MTGQGDEVVATEYLYELWDANWDDGALGHYTILRHEITKKTPKRIYFVMGNGRSGFVDRQRIEANGEIYHGYTLRRLHLAPPEIPHQPKPASLADLKAAMAAAHPDRGGTDEAFIAARARYERAARLGKLTEDFLAKQAQGQTSPSKGDQVT